MTEREKFEAWAKQPPREWDLWLNPPDHGWPDQYRAYHVQCAWEVWRELASEVERLKALLKEAADDLDHWGGYAPEYFQEKHSLKSDIEKYREAGK